MKFFQRIYDAIKGIKTPSWLRAIFAEIQTLLISIALQVGKNYLEDIKSKILAVSVEDISGSEKFDKVFDYCRKELRLHDIKDEYLDLLIQSVVTVMKKRGAIA